MGEDVSFMNPIASEVASPDGDRFTDDSSLIEDDGAGTLCPEDSPAAYGFGNPAAIEGLREAVARLSEQIAQDHARAAAREKTIDRLHGELERLRAGEARLLLRPVIADLRRLHHDLLAQARSAADTISPAEAVALLESFAESAELALERCGVAVIRPNPGAPCKPGAHQVTAFEPTDDASLDGRIMKIASEGYLDIDSGRPIAPARVIIYRATHVEEKPWSDPDVEIGVGPQVEESPPPGEAVGLSST